MCGIVGSFGTGPAPLGELEKLAGTLLHRGPDHTGIYKSGPVELAMTRLAIIDLAGGQQPMKSADEKIVLVFNGEIYNYQELRAKLAPHIGFQTRSDTEVILNGYQVWGDAVFAKLNGIFALALWDARHAELRLVRDPLGVKPLYVAHSNKRVYFSSEIKSFTQTGLANSANLLAVSQYLSSGYVFSPHCAVRDVEQVMPGELVVYSPTGQERRSIFRYPGPAKPDKKWQAEARDDAALDAALGRAIIGQTVADVPYGLLLSSGLDSMAILSALRRANLTENLETFTVAFNEDEFGEQAHVQALASAWGFRNTITTFTAADVTKNWAAACLTFDNLEMLPTALGIQQAARVAGPKVKVLLAGNGGDEVFSGYPTYKATDYVRRFGPALGPLVAVARGLAKHLPASAGYLGKAEKIRRFLNGYDADPALAHLQWRSIFSQPDLARVMVGNQDSPYAAQLAHRATAAELGYMNEDADSWVDLCSWLVDCGLMMWDKAGMSASIEIRTPLIDPDFLDFAYGIPLRQRAGRGGLGSKSRLRSMLAAHLPPAISNLPKHGFQLPLTQWLQGPLKTLFRDLTATLPAHHFNQGEIGKLWDEFGAGRGDHGLQLWCLGALAGWSDAHRIRWP